jgi:hypothetical protein
MPAAVFCPLIRVLDPWPCAPPWQPPCWSACGGCDGKKPAAPAMTPVEVTALEIKPQSAPMTVDALVT